MGDVDTSGANGGLTITIPTAGKYTLKENVAPIGYNKLTPLSRSMQNTLTVW